MRIQADLRSPPRNAPEHRLASRVDHRHAGVHHMRTARQQPQHPARLPLQSAGLPRILPSKATTVSAPMTRAGAVCLPAAVLCLLEGQRLHRLLRVLCIQPSPPRRPGRCQRSGPSAPEFPFSGARPTPKSASFSFACHSSTDTDPITLPPLTPRRMIRAAPGILRIRIHTI